MNESSRVYARKADNGAGLGRAQLAGEETKGTVSTEVKVVCLLPPEGDTVDDLTRVLRREGAVEIEVVMLEPQDVHKAFTPHRGRLDHLAELSLGWTVTAGVPARSLALLMDALANRPGLRILEQQRPPVAEEDPTVPHRLRITVFR